MKLKMNFISASTLNGKTDMERVDFILGQIKGNSLLIIDGVLHPQEEMELIAETMRRVSDGFPGIEVCSMKREGSRYSLLLNRLLDQRDRLMKMLRTLTGFQVDTYSLRTGITLIGPAKVIKKIKKNPDSFFVLAEV